MEEQNTVTLKERLQIFAGGTALSAMLGIGSLFFHSFPGEPILLLGPMLISLAEGKPIRDAMLEFRTYLAPQLSKEQFNTIVDKHVENDNSQLDQSATAKFKRILSLFTSDTEQQVVSKPKEEREIPFRKAKNDSFEYEEDSEFPAKFTLDLVLDRIKKYNRQNKLYLGTSCQGDIALNVADVYHILHVAKSGRGKSNDLRFIMMQLVQICECYCINPMGNNKKRLKSDDPRKYEIWKPIYESLENRHVVKEPAEIEKLLKHVAKIVKHRVAHEEEDSTWSPIFLFIDEMKMVKDLYPDLEEPLSTIAMSGRQTWVFLFGASQTAYVGDIGLKTGTQTQFQTILYAGGSDKSMNKLTQGQITNEVEEKLRANKGLRALFIEGEEKFTWIRTPLTTNEAVFEFFNLEFNLEDWENNVPLERISNSNSISNFPEDEEDDPEMQNDDFEEEIEIEKETWDDDKIVVRIGDQELTEGQVYMRIWDAITFLQQKKIEMEAKNVSGKRLPEIVTINAIIEKAGLGNGQREYVIRIAEELNVELDKSNKGRKAKANV